MELQWDDDPVPDGPFFTRDLYDKYSLSPHIRELWTFLQSPVENSDIKQRCEEAAADHSIPPLKDAAQVKESSCFDSQASGGESCYTDDPSAGNDAEEPKNSKRSKNSKGKTNKEVDVAYPEPRLPYPCMSSLTCKDQKTYLGYLMSKKTRGPPRNLTMRINNEVMQFMMYLQDVAKICAEDYNFITQGAMQYTEEFFQACLESVKALPQFYQIHEMTSLTGGTFNPGLALTFEKQLLAMGTVSLTDHKMVPADAQLASDYPSVSSANPPAKKAKDKHAMISRDGNAEKLCSYYEPHVCLTRDALLRLLDNHGPDFGDYWELPVMVKATAGKGSNKRKTLYVDSPLLKQEVTIRERSQIYHEESLKLSILTNGSKKIFHLMTERPADEHQLSQETSVRGSMSVENNGLDFEVDLTDLETFGEITIKAPIKEKKRQQDEGVQSNKPTSTPDRTKSNISSNCLTASCSSQEEINTVSKTTENLRTETSHQSVSEAEMPKTKSTGSQQILDDQPEFMADSDDEKLIIDDSGSVLASPTNQLKPLNIESSTDPLITSPVKPTLEMIGYSPPSKRTRSKRTTIQAKAPGDQLGEILRMQTAMFKSGNESTTPIKSPSRCVEPQLNTHQTSLVKPCVSSYLKRQQNEDGEFPIVPSESASANIIPTEHKKILSENLQSCAEDEQDYEAPVEGNLLYKLYSLQDLLVMVRSSVSLTHSRNVANIQNQFVPVHVLPKLEYQLSYGVEYLTSSEACQLWTETALHSSTVSYIAHINAHTSKVALLRKLPDDWMQNISCGFKPSKSLNILHHLLKKLTGLDEGQYLVVHKAREPFVTLLKATGQKGNQGAYNLQQAHSSVPQPPSLCYLPWIPVDPAVVLPFHQQHGRVPCTFPPKTFQKTDGVNNDNRAGQKKNPNAQKKGKKKKPSGKYKRYNKKQVQKSV